MPSDQTGVSSCIIKMDGEAVVQANSSGTNGAGQPAGHMYMESAQVDKRLDCPDMFLLDLDIRVGADIQLLDELREGKEVEILMGPMGQEATVLKGEIHYLEPHFRHGGKSTVTVGGFDRSHRLTRGTRSRTWGDGIQAQDLYPSVVRDVITKSEDHSGTRDGLSPDTVDGPGAKFAYIPQMNVSDYLFMKSLGRDVDKKVDADTDEDDRKVSFHKVEVSGNPAIILVRESAHADGEVAIHEAHFNLSTVQQYAKVEVRGWDPKKKKAILGTCKAAEYDMGGSTKGWEATGEALYGSAGSGKVLTIVDRPVDSKEEAEAVAKAVFNQMSMEFITGEVDFKGDPALNPGDLVELKQFGERFSGRYLVTQVTQFMVPRSMGFTTRLKIARNDLGPAPEESG
ncbi:MAG: phage late control D family protein [Deltaproteobacteria bacterium]|nr:phage late control D family protein [Deltaproteobacteria bacterium]